MKNKSSEGKGIKDISSVIEAVVNLFGIPENKLKDFMYEFVDFIEKYKLKNNL